MRQISQAEALLKHLGLTEYESKAYLALLLNGPLSAEKVSSAAEIPLPRVYDTMAGLSQRGFIIVSKTRPQIFKSMNPEQISQLLQEDEKKKFDVKLKGIESTIPQFLKEISSLPTKVNAEQDIALSYVSRKVNIEKLWSEMHSQAKSEMFLFAGDMSWVNETASKIKATLKKGIDYRVLWCKDDKDIIQNVKKAVKIGIPLRYSDTGDLRGVIIDRERVSLVQNPPGTRMVEKNAEKEGAYVNILINNKLIADIFRRYFLLLWQNAYPAERWLAKKGLK